MRDDALARASTLILTPQVLNPGESLVSVESISRYRGVGNIVPLDYTGRGTRLQFLMDAEEFNSTQQFIIEATTRTVNQGETKITLHAFLTDKVKMIRPDTMSTYRIAAAISN